MKSSNEEGTPRGWNAERSANRYPGHEHGVGLRHCRSRAVQDLSETRPPQIVGPAGRMPWAQQPELVPPRAWALALRRVQLQLPGDGSEMVHRASGNRRKWHLLHDLPGNER